MKFYDDDRDHLTADSGNGNDVRWRATVVMQKVLKTGMIGRVTGWRAGAGVHTLRTTRVPAWLVPSNSREFDRHSGEKNEKSLWFPGWEENSATLVKKWEEDRPKVPD